MKYDAQILKRWLEWPYSFSPSPSRILLLVPLTPFSAEQDSILRRRGRFSGVLALGPSGRRR